MGAIAGCGSAGADVLAVWVDAQRNADGSRAIHFWRSGERVDRTLASEVPESLPTDLQIVAGPRGESAALLGPQALVHYALDTHRVHELALSAYARVVAPRLAFTGLGDAVLLHGVDAQGSVALLPTALASAEPLILPRPPMRYGEAPPMLTSARDAPRLLWTERVAVTENGVSENRLTLELLEYPSSGGAAGHIAAPIVLARGIVHTPWVPAGPARLATACELPGVCLSPEGTSVMVAGARCRLAWWRADAARQPADLVEASPLVLEAPCDPSRPVEPILALGDDVLALADDERIYVAHLDDGAVEAAPLPWNGSVFPAVDGRAMTVVSAQLQALRVSPAGVRILNQRAVRCPGDLTTRADEAGFHVSPRGHWILGWCNDPNVLGGVGVVWRVSSLGFESFGGINLAGLGIDDEGNALLYSFGPGGEPRGLFVLTSDGRVERVDELEPEPAAIPGRLDAFAPYFAFSSFDR